MTRRARWPPLRSRQATPIARVERLIFLSVFNPEEKPWIRRVDLEARYEDPLHEERAHHRWRYRVPGKRGLSIAEPWHLDVTGVPRGAVIRYDGRLVIAGGPNRTIEALYSQKAFLVLDPRFTPASVGVDPGAVDWSVVQLVKVDLFQVNDAGEEVNLETQIFELLDFRGVFTPPPPQYYTYQVPFGTPTVYHYRVTYYDDQNSPVTQGPFASGDSWLVLPPVLS